MTSIRDAFNRTQKGQALIAMADRYDEEVQKVKAEKKLIARTAILNGLARKMFVKIGHDSASFDKAQDSINTICSTANYKTFQKAKYALDGMYVTPVSRQDARKNAVKALEKYAFAAEANMT